MKKGIELIALERQRQIEEKGFSIIDDLRHEDGELADAGAYYALSEEMVPNSRNKG